MGGGEGSPSAGPARNTDADDETIAGDAVTLMQKIAFRHRLEYVAVLGIRAVLRVLPRTATLRVGAALGRAFYLLHGRRRELAVANLRLAFPTTSDRECRQILRSTFAHFGRHVVEFLNFAAMSVVEVRRLIDVEGENHVTAAMARGRGVLFCSGHFGYWELQIMAHAIWFEPLVVVARPLDNPFLDRLIGQIRTRLGTHAIPRQGAVRGLLTSLRENHSTAIMIDQHMHGRRAVVVDFFGRPAATTSAAAALALKTGAALIPVFALPIPGGRYRMIYDAPIAPPAEDDPDAVLTYTQRSTDALENYVRRYPELWLWMHRRWRAGDASERAATSVAASDGDVNPTDAAV